MINRMEKPKLGHLLVKLDKLLDRYVDSGPEAPRSRSTRPLSGTAPARACGPSSGRPQIDQDDLIGIDSIKKEVIRNTRNFIKGVRANNVLLWGERGTGKSSVVKSLLTTFADTNLQADPGLQARHPDHPGDVRHCSSRTAAYRFIVFIDDLSFEESQTDYKEIKTILDGGLEAIPDNVLFYATSNRKHLIPTRFSDNESDEIRPVRHGRGKGLPRGAFRAPLRLLPLLPGHLPRDRRLLCQEVRSGAWTRKSSNAWPCNGRSGPAAGTAGSPNSSCAPCLTVPRSDFPLYH